MTPSEIKYQVHGRPPDEDSQKKRILQFFQFIGANRRKRSRATSNYWKIAVVCPNFGQDKGGINIYSLGKFATEVHYYFYSNSIWRVLQRREQGDTGHGEANFRPPKLR